MNTATFIIFAFIIALILSLFISFGFRNRGPWGSLWISFLIIFLVVWAASLWIRPVGPLFYGVAWVPLFFVGIVVAVILAAAVPPASDVPLEKNELNKTDVPDEKNELRKEEAVTNPLPWDSSSGSLLSCWLSPLY